jgi:hypothetical protein
MSEEEVLEYSVESAIRESTIPGQLLLTPSRSKPFTVDRIDNEGVVLLLGRKEAATRLTWACLEGTVPFIRSHGGAVPIGGRHDVEGNPGTLDEWLKGCINRTTAGWVAVVLETAGIVDVVGTTPQSVRLTAGWQ